MCLGAGGGGGGIGVVVLESIEFAIDTNLRGANCIKITCDKFYKNP